MAFSCMSFLLVRDGEGRVQVDCFHPRDEFFVREITEKVAENLGCSSVVADVYRSKFDLNAETCEEYLEILRRNVSIRGSPYLVVIIHGMRDRAGRDIEIGTGRGKNCDEEVCAWFVASMKKEFRGFRIVVDEEFAGEKSLGRYKFEGVNLIQLEFSRKMREENREKIVDGLTRVLSGFDM